MDSPNHTDPLSRSLADWRVAPRRNPQFRAAVSARLAAPAGAVAWGDYARRHTGAVAGALALAILVGAFGGHERAHARAAAESARLAAAYVQGLDARTMAMR